MLDEINEQTDQMQQIQDAMAQPIGPAADVDEDELMGELEVIGLKTVLPTPMNARKMFVLNSVTSSSWPDMVVLWLTTLCMLCRADRYETLLALI